MYEVPFGVTLRELLDMAGGIADGRELQAVLFGGAAGAFATPSSLDVKLTFEDLRAAGLPLGSGVVMVFDETRDLRDVLSALGTSSRTSSCGKCYPCQMGTQRQKEILERVAAGRSGGRFGALAGHRLDDDGCEPVWPGPNGRGRRAFRDQALAGDVRRQGSANGPLGRRRRNQEPETLAGAGQQPTKKAGAPARPAIAKAAGEEAGPARGSSRARDPDAIQLRPR